MNPVESRSVSFWETHLWCEQKIDGIDFPMIGTPQWCRLSDDDPAKMAAVYDAAQHHALRVETAQESRKQASDAVSEAADWKHVAQELTQRSAFHAGHPWARRTAVTR
ncbi:MAG TPA: DUF2742 domain-containing protein [Mycobacterium sp.]|nr:DUF2742 domain-containing protein [Mycobacterium sp.]